MSASLSLAATIRRAALSLFLLIELRQIIYAWFARLSSRAKRGTSHRLECHANVRSVATTSNEGFLALLGLTWKKGLFALFSFFALPVAAARSNGASRATRGSDRKS